MFTSPSFGKPSIFFFSFHFFFDSITQEKKNDEALYSHKESFYSVMLDRGGLTFLGEALPHKTLFQQCIRKKK